MFSFRSWRPWQALAATTLLVIGAQTPPARADTYPSRPVTFVLPFAAGSSTDTTARVVGEYLQKALGQSIVIENKPGAGGMVAAQAVANARPDGYTLLLTTNSSHSAAPALFKNVPYDPIKDFTPIARIGTLSAVVVVNPKAPFKSMAELIAYAKANPGKLTYGFGNSTGRVIGETLKRTTGVQILAVPYRSDPTGNTDLIAGHIPIMIPSLASSESYIRSEQMRALAVADAARNPRIQDTPTLDETVMPGFNLAAWVGLFGPAKLPPDIANMLAGKIKEAVAQPAVLDSFARSGIQAQWGDPQEFSKFVATELVKWTTMIKQAGIEPE